MNSASDPTPATPDSLRRIAEALPATWPSDRRYVIAIAGPPAAGKTTLANALVRFLADEAAALGMDAFHFDDRLLIERGHHDRKGAPHTFDVNGYERMLRLLRSEPNSDIAIPEFDRSLELTRSAASVVTRNHRIIVTEGNYLLLDDDPWLKLAPLFDLTVWLDVDEAELERRLINRWKHHGFSAEQARHRAARNDLPNAMLVSTRSRAADLSIRETS